MHFKLFSIIILSALSLASPDPSPALATDDSNESDLLLKSLSDLATQTISMPTNIPTLPSSIESVLITAVPTSFLSEMSNLTAWSSVTSEWKDGHFPSWYSSLNGDVKSYLSTAFDTASPSTSTSHGGAPAPTAMAAGVVGAAGILGLAIVL